MKLSNARDTELFRKGASYEQHLRTRLPQKHNEPFEGILQNEEVRTDEQIPRGFGCHPDASLHHSFHLPWRRLDLQHLPVQGQQIVSGTDREHIG